VFKQYIGNPTNPATMKVELCVHASAREYFLSARRYAIKRGTSNGRVSVCLPQVGVLSKHRDVSSWFWACRHVSFNLSYCVLGLIRKLGCL